jgi:glutamate/tyrosine decarboxylase-like PLP-dependent enzyme
VDDLVSILALREQFERKGLTFYIHVDAAWGGYFASVLRTEGERGKTNHPVKEIFFF